MCTYEILVLLKFKSSRTQYFQPTSQKEERVFYVYYLEVLRNPKFIDYNIKQNADGSDGQSKLSVVI